MSPSPGRQSINTNIADALVTVNASVHSVKSERTDSTPLLKVKVGKVQVLRCTNDKSHFTISKAMNVWIMLQKCLMCVVTE